MWLEEGQIWKNWLCCLRTVSVHTIQFPGTVNLALHVHAVCVLCAPLKISMGSLLSREPVYANDIVGRRELYNKA